MIKQLSSKIRAQSKLIKILYINKNLCYNIKRNRDTGHGSPDVKLTNNRQVFEAMDGYLFFLMQSSVKAINAKMKIN